MSGPRAKGNCMPRAAVPPCRMRTTPRVTCASSACRMPPCRRAACHMRTTLRVTCASSGEWGD
eukprot:941216-Prymnesium_polylepis.1